MTVPLKVGMLGAGYILKSHATAVQHIPGVELAWVADSSTSRAHQAAATYGFANATDDAAVLAASNCDVVHILLPPAQHVSSAMQMIKSGKSVFLEKPMGLSSAECGALCDEADRRGVTVGVSHNFLFARSYEAIRDRIKAGQLGSIDWIGVNWHFSLPQLQHGPFNAWMLDQPSNLIFEIAPHLLGFVVDLVGEPTIEAAVASRPLQLPGGKTAYRHWQIICRKGPTVMALSLSANPGFEDRSLRLRATAGNAQLDFGRDYGWVEDVTAANPVMDSFVTARRIARSVSRAAWSDVVRRTMLTLRKHPWANPFEESIARSIAKFYEGGVANLDPRHDGRLGAKIIYACEQISAAAGTGLPSTSVSTPPSMSLKVAPTVLVVGGTGFIGRRLVRSLVERGVGVRLLTRNAHSARLEFSDCSLDIVEGSHGDRALVATCLDGIDTVFHLAKCEGKNWKDYVDGDLTPTRTLAEEATHAGVRRFVYTGTIDSYASANARSVIDNATPLDPKIRSRNLYARAKAAGESLLRDIVSPTAMELVILRPGIVLGAGGPPAHLGIGNFAGEGRVDYWGDGTNALPIVLVDDVVDALVSAMTVPGIDGRTFLLTGPPMLSARDYVDALAKRSGTMIAADSKSAWRYWLADLVKQGLKFAIRHPNRRWPTLHDWDSRSHRARYDSSGTQRDLGWMPEADREVIIEHGIGQVVDATR